MKRRYLISTGLLVYIFALIASAPATLMDGSLQRISQGQLRLVEAQGTVWSGAGNIELRDAGGQTGIAKSITWRMLPTSLLRGHIVYEVGMAADTQPFAVTVSLSQIALTNADISLPATVLSLGIPKFEPFGLSGDLLLHIDHLSIGNKQTQGKLIVQWRNAGSALTANTPLGDYVMNVDGDGATTHVVLRTIHGLLQLNGKGSWATGGKPDYVVTAYVPPQHQQQLSPLLRLVATERSAGNFELNFR